MKLFINKFFSAFVFLFFCSQIQAQNIFFNDAVEASFKITDQKRVIVPEKFRTIKLDSAGILSFLRLLPQEQFLPNRNLAPVLEIPMPDGSFAKFRVWESAVMAPELAAAYPQLKTFTGQGIDDPTATIKLDWTSFGFHAMILSPISGTVFIDPYDQQNIFNYISYYKSDYKRKGTFIEQGPIRFSKDAKTQTENPLAGVCIGTQLRTYRLAVACTNQYAIKATGLANPTKAQTLAKIVISTNRVNGVYEKELSVRLVLVANDTLVIFTSPATDLFTGNDNPNVLINESQSIIDARIDTANYDIGHTFSTGGGGLAGLGVVCVNGQKASGITGSSNPVGDAYDIDYVAHEMGHQFGANHTFNSYSGYCGGGNGNATTNAEPGSGSTIMAYAGICSPDNLQNNSDAQFHAISFDEITSYSINSSGNGCAVKTATGNLVPVVNAGASYNIPLSTPFVLTGSATDGNGDALTYCWEQVDVGGPFGAWNSPVGDAPLFRSFMPVSTPSRYFPKLSDQINNTTTIGEILPAYSRIMNFRLTARDNRAGGGGVCYAQTTVTAVVANGPFLVTYPSASAIVWYVGDFKTITWNTAGTSVSPINCSMVNIQLSTDGGLTFPITILSNAINDGTEEIQVPNNISTQARIRVMAVGNIFYDFSDNNFTIQNSPTSTFVFNSPAAVAVCSASSGTATVKTSGLNGFSTTINLSASLNPPGTTVSFGATSIAPGASTTVTLNNTAGLAAGIYTVRVTGIAGSITKTTDLNFIVGNGIAPASLTAPANDAIGVSTLPLFNWSASSGQNTYTIEISTTSNFASIVQSISNIGTNSFALITALIENTIYYWRIKSTNACGTGAPNTVPNRFKTGLNSCRNSSDVPKFISDIGSPTITSTLIIPAALGAVITDLNVVGLMGTHSYVSDLRFTLTSPNNTSVVILDTICNGSFADFNLNLDDQATINYASCPPTAGATIKPRNPLSAFNGQSSTGTWTLTVKDLYDQDGGYLDGWGLSINTNSTTCTFIATPLATTYTFTGTGNWNIASNWSGNTIPPSPLPANSAIVINHTVGGICTLNVTQQIAAGASLTVLSGKNLIVPGVLTIQ